ncbi:MAG TPA: hypothetical protein VH092_05430 [Urbifossiella sp.]|nr:hypothetical protein [Urbifossiella sp.]
MPKETAALLEPSIRSGLPGSFRSGSAVYAIALVLDSHPTSEEPDDALQMLGGVLQKHGFTWQQGSVYFGGPEINAVTCVLAAQDLARSLPWFAASVRDIRMLRIEEMNDLMAAVQQAAGGPV